METQSAFRTALREVSDWCCVKVSRQDSPHFSIERENYSLKAASFTLYDTWKNFAGMMIVHGGDNPFVTFVGPPLHNGFLKECVAADTRKGKFSGLIFITEDEADGFDVREDPAKDSILGRIWDKAHISVASLFKQDGMLDNEVIERAVCKIGSAYRKALALEPFVNPVRVPKLKLPKAETNPAPHA